MRFTMAHTNLNVTDLEKSLAFYQKALGLEPVRHVKAGDGSFEIAFISDGASAYQIELTWLRDKTSKYELGDNETHIAFIAEDFASARKAHDEMGCVCFENPNMGIYFIEDPDGYWLEIIPKKS